jgi:transposase
MDGRSSIPGDGREWRRLRAVALKRQGWQQRDIASALGVREETVGRWVARAGRGGIGSLRARPGAGRPPRLAPDQARLIPEFLWHGAEAYGFRGEVWTCARVAKVIQEEFGVRYHKSHVGKLLAKLRWTPQVPVRRAIQRDEQAIERWRDEAWPEILEKARKERRTLVFEDESGFYLLPGLVRTYAPQAQTPVIREKATRDHLSVMGGMTLEGRVYTFVRQESLSGLHVIEFLKHLQAVAGNRLLVVWDGSPIHRRLAVKDFVAASKGRIWLEMLPGYAPDLNPWDEGGWHHLKNVQMRNMACRDLEELHEQFHLAVDRLRRRPRLVQAFFAQAGLPLTAT